jgi:hypothetical protein
MISVMGLIVTHDFMAHADIAVSARHLTHLTKLLEVDRTTGSYESMAIQGLRQAISTFSASTCEAAFMTTYTLALIAPRW